MAKCCPEKAAAENFLSNRIHAGSHVFIGNNTRQAVNRGLADYRTHLVVQGAVMPHSTECFPWP